MAFLERYVSCANAVDLGAGAHAAKCVTPSDLLTYYLADDHVAINEDDPKKEDRRQIRRAVTDHGRTWSATIVRWAFTSAGAVLNLRCAYVKAIMGG